MAMSTLGKTVCTLPILLPASSSSRFSVSSFLPPSPSTFGAAKAAGSLRPLLHPPRSRRGEAFRFGGSRSVSGGFEVVSAAGASESSSAGNAAGAATMEAEKVVPAVIIGGGRVGQALEKMGGGKDVVVRRGEAIPEGSEGPIFVCTRNDSLDSIVEATPPARREDLVFIQNGMLEPFLESKGLQQATVVLVYFAVAKAGDLPMDGKTDLNPEGLTSACGKWASATASRLHSAGLSCTVLDSEEFKKPLLEKLIWICAFMLVGARHPGATVGVVESEYRDEVVSLIKELAAAAETEKSTKFDPGVEDRLCSYARSVAHFPTAVKEMDGLLPPCFIVYRTSKFQWRNGWFYGISEKAIAKGESDPLPLHTAGLKEVGAI